MNATVLYEMLERPNLILAIIAILAFFYFVSRGKKVLISIKNIITIYFEDLRVKKRPKDDPEKYFTEE